MTSVKTETSTELFLLSSSGTNNAHDGTLHLRCLQYQLLRVSLKIQEVFNFNVNDWKGMSKIQSSMPKGNICKSQMIKRQIVLKQCLIKIMLQRSVPLSDFLIL